MCARVIAGCTSGVTTMLIPFSRLYLSDANVRKTRSEEDDIQLSADIEARGLLQNLLVTKSKKRGKFAVIAGGRRLRAIEMIVARGAWAPDAEIECKLLEGSEEEAGEASLAENFQRVGMSPAEECRAFQHFIKEGGDVAAVAKRFGLTQRFVEGRLRLANLAEPIFEALAKGDVTLEIAKAYAATDQHEVQLRVFEQMRYAYNPSADAIRRMVASGSMRGNDPIALLIGEDAYAVAISLEAKKGYGSEYHPIHAVIGSMLDIDVAAMWRPTAENFFDRVSKASCLAALTEVGGSDLAARYAASKKADLAKTCETIFAGKAIVEQDVKEAALAWLPEGMKFTIGANPADPVIPDTDESEPVADVCDGDDGGAIASCNGKEASCPATSITATAAHSSLTD